MKISVCISKTFKNLFDPDVLKVVFILSIPVFAFYVGALFLFWDQIIYFVSNLIFWIPFSVLKLNGAFFIMFFLWFISVVVTFAIISAIFSPLFLNKANEKIHYLYVISSILFFSIFYAFIFINNWDFIYFEIQKLLTILPFDTVSKTVSAILSIYVFYNFFILTLFILVFFFAKPFLEAIKDVEYPDVEINSDRTLGFKRILLKDVLIFLIFFVLLFPLFFIPVVNVLVPLLLWTKLYHDSFLYFVCNEYCFGETLKKLEENRLKTLFLASIAASFNFLPIINFFAPFFAIILFFHCVMQLQTSV